ncbi:hypothetical protein COCON_G00031900 [Conger conger]|uniref:Uncharacterized protein n=1 Tax=Conger conger TaxID=82655 RepID=A0A9Q1I781_CONCO|nr:hypothetical protein COCON_G00031900 [Conger conger]
MPFHNFKKGCLTVQHSEFIYLRRIRSSGYALWTPAPARSAQEHDSGENNGSIHLTIEIRVHQCTLFAVSQDAGCTTLCRRQCFPL